MNRMVKTIAQRLKALRKERGWNQAQLAKRAGVSFGYLARLETCRHDPQVGTLVKLAKALKVPVAELVDERAKEEP
jgi:transcriptional regulator with XRE-family HTH domain